jgi:hypothetical protein
MRKLVNEISDEEISKMSNEEIDEQIKKLWIEFQKDCIQYRKETEEWRKKNYESAPPEQKAMMDHLKQCKACHDWIMDKIGMYMDQHRDKEGNLQNLGEGIEYLNSIYNRVHTLHKYHGWKDSIV